MQLQLFCIIIISYADMTEFVKSEMFKNIHIQEEKTMAKKILAILLALSFVFAFAACGGKDDDATTTAPVETTEDPFAAENTTAIPRSADTSSHKE